jgi:hypothetical protein
MDERSGTIHLVESQDPGARSLVTTISRSEVEHALHEDEGVDLVLDVERLAADGDGRENERIALAWTPEDLERLLAMSSADEITLTFDEEEVRRFLDDDVDAHGMRVKLAALTAVAGMAAAGAGAAGAMPTLAASDHGVLTSATEAGIVQQPTSQPVSASPSDSTWSPSSAEIGAFAGVILTIPAAGFAVRHQRHGGGPAPV